MQKNTAENSGVWYSISKTKNMNWNEQINGLYNKQGLIRRSDTLVVENSTPAYLQSDVIENLPLVIPLSVVTKASNGKDILHSIKQENIEDLQRGIRNADITIKNPDRNSFVFVTDIKQDGYPVLVSFLQNTEFDGDRVHKATSIHLQTDVTSMLESLPNTATVYFKNKKELNNAVGVTNNLRSLAANVEFIDKTVSQKNKDVKQKQLEIILKTNPAYSDSFTWIRKVEDIHTLEETLSLSDWKDYDEFDPDLTKSDILKAIESGEITVYSSHPIENGAFVTPSRMEVETYAGTGEVYQKTVDINDVAWIDPTQGQLAKINGNTNDLAPVKYSLSESETIDNYTEEQYNNFGWTRYNEVLDNNDIKYITQEIQKIKNGNMRGYVRTQYGDYIIPIGNKYNLLVYTDDNIESPHIRKVLEINSEDQILLDSIRRDIQDANSEKLQMADDYVRRIYGPENFVEYKRQNFTSFRGYIKSQQERMVSGTSSNVSAAGVDGPDSIRQNSQTDRADLKRSAFSLSEQGETPAKHGNFNIYGEDVKLDTTPSEDIAPVKESVSLTESIETDLEKAVSDYVENNLEDVAADIKVLKIKNIFTGTRKGFVRILSDGTYESGVEGTGSGGFVPNENLIRTDSLEEALSEQYKYMLENSQGDISRTIQKHADNYDNVHNATVEDIAPVMDNIAGKTYISMEDFANREGSVWNNVDFNDDATKRSIMQETHNNMVSEGSVVVVSDEVLTNVEQSFPDLRTIKKKERTPILKEAMSKLKNNIRQFLNGLKYQNFEFEVNGKVLEAKLYNTGINEVLEKVTQEKANMLYSTEDIFKNSRYLYSTQDYDSDPNVYRWNYFYTPVQIGENIVGVRIAVRDLAKQGESQIYNWGIKKDTSLDGVRDDSLNRKSHDVSSNVSIHSISNIAPIVNKQDISAIETAEEISKIDSDIKLEGQPKTRKQLHNKIIDNIKSVFSGKGFDFDTKVHNSCMQKRAESFLSALQIILHSRLHGFHG